jgi:hypothetical protein
MMRQGHDVISVRQLAAEMEFVTVEKNIHEKNILDNQVVFK